MTGLSFDVLMVFCFLYFMKVSSGEYSYNVETCSFQCTLFSCFCLFHDFINFALSSLVLVAFVLSTQFWVQLVFHNLVG